jgi:hypothetical protein
MHYQDVLNHEHQLHMMLCMYSYIFAPEMHVVIEVCPQILSPDTQDGFDILLTVYHYVSQ